MSIGDGDDEEIVTGTEGEDTTGTDTGAGDEDSEVSAEHPDQEEDDGEQVDAETEEKPTRAQSRIQRLANEAKAAREEARIAREEASEARREARQRQQGDSEEVRQAKRALMTAEERLTDDMAQMRREFTVSRQQDQMNTQVLMDKTAYEAKATINPTYAKFKDEVEARFADQLRKGAPVEREIILKVLLGERALAGASNAKPRKAAASRVAAQKVASSSGKGDTASNRGKAGDTAEIRLKDVFI